MIAKSKKTDTGYQIKFFAPGVSKEDIKIKSEGTYFSVYAESDDPYEYKIDKQFELHGSLDGSMAIASLDKGILTIDIPYSENSQPKYIQVA
jgi:HSP20 family molecular chaperone IbpA